MKNARLVAAILAGIVVGLSVPQAWAQERFVYDGENGFKQSFTLAGGQYKLYVYAQDPIPGYLPPGFEHCVFSGSLERRSPSYESLPLGSVIKISQKDWTPWKIDREIYLAAGQYTLSILSTTDCKWNFSLSAKTSSEPIERSAISLTSECFLRNCVMPPIALSAGSAKDSERSLSLQASMVEFVAPFVRRGNSVEPSGTCLIKQGDKTLKEQPLQVDNDPVNHHDHFYVIQKWEKDATPSAGKITVEFVTTVGSSSAEFTVTE